MENCLLRAETNGRYGVDALLCEEKWRVKVVLNGLHAGLSERKAATTLLHETPNELDGVLSGGGLGFNELR
jgi:hypothetical protein